MKMLFIGDIHGKKQSPLDRLCDYNEDQYKKLEWIRDYAIKNDIKVIVHLGDIADKPEMPEEWKNRFIQIWKQYQPYGKFYTIPGLLHDYFHNREESYSKTCLYNLELSGVIEMIRETVDFGDVALMPLSMFTKEAKEQIRFIDKTFKIGTEYVLLAHQFYDWELNKDAGFTEDELMTICTPCSLVLGHDHRQHNDIQVGHVTVRRPGSLMRTELSETTIAMRPRVLLYDSHIWTYLEVPHRPIEEIYNVTEYRNNKANAKVFRDLKNNLEGISKYFHQTNDIILCSEALSKLNCPVEEYEYLKAVHQTCCQEF